MPSVEIRQDVETNQGLTIGVNNGPVALNLYYTKPKADRVQVPAGARHRLWGREAEVGQAVQALQERKTFLIHGMGGIGKTALEAEIAKQLYPSFPGGVLWISEIGRASAGAICDAIARSLGDEEILKLPAEAKPDLTRELLGRKQLLLILDDLAEAATAQAFLSRCLPEGMPLLTTSRYQHLGFERDIGVKPLQPDAAAELFRDRAKLESADGSVEQICELLENHPLALVIAAGRARAEQMPLASLHTRLEDEKTRLKTLKIGDSQDKNLNVWASIAVSYTDLKEETQKMFLLLAACFGETTGLELLTDICGLSGQECEDRLGVLVSRSLVERSGYRFELHLLVRDFGRDALKHKGSWVDTQTQLLDGMLAYARKYQRGMHEDYNKLEEEAVNLFGVAQIAARFNLAQTVIELTNTLIPMAQLKGYWDERIGLGINGIQAARRIGSKVELVKFLYDTGTALHDQGQLIEAMKYYEEGLAISQKLGDQKWVSTNLHQMGSILRNQGDHSTAFELFQKSLDIDQSQNNQIGAYANFLGMAIVAFDRRDYQEAERLLFASLEKATEQKDLSAIAGGLSELGILAKAQHNFLKSSHLLSKSLEIKERLSDLSGIALDLHHLGEIKRGQFQFSEAKTILNRSLKISIKLGSLQGISSNLRSLGLIAHMLGNYPEAQKLLEESLGLERRMGDQSGIAQDLLLLGVLAEDDGRTQEARRLLLESKSILEQIRSPFLSQVRKVLNRAMWPSILRLPARALYKFVRQFINRQTFKLENMLETEEK